MAEEDAPMSLAEVLTKAGEAFGADRYDEAVKMYTEVWSQYSWRTQARAARVPRS